MVARTILYVNGFHPNTRARDLAWEFERYGRLVRCDIPASPNPNREPFSFVEFRHERDAEDAYHYMHRKKIDGYVISVQWAKKTPSREWRYEQSDGIHSRPRRLEDRSRAGQATRDDKNRDDRRRDSQRRPESPRPSTSRRDHSREDRKSQGRPRSQSPGKAPRVRPASRSPHFQAGPSDAGLSRMDERPDGGGD